MNKKAIALQKSCIKKLYKSELYDQKEVNGVKALQPLFGEGRKTGQAIFSVRGQVQQIHAELTWYDSREDDPTRRGEYRLYYEPNGVMEQAEPGDDLVIGYDDNNQLNCILFKKTEG